MMRQILLAALAVAAVLCVTNGGPVNLEPPTVTDGGFRVTGYKVDLSADVGSIIAEARELEEDVAVFAVEVVIKSEMVVAGIPNLRIYAHRCVVDGTARILGPGKDAGDQTAAPSLPAVQGFLGGDASTNVLMACGSINKVTSSSSLEIVLNGGRGGKGGPGRDGAPGTASTPGIDGQCKRKGFKCVMRDGQFGQIATDGKNGARGGTGGKGGKAGNLSLRSFDGETSLNVSSNLSGGFGGTGGSGGGGGRPGSTAEDAGYKHALSCKKLRILKCKFQFTVRSAREPKNGRDARQGSTGAQGETGERLTGAVGTSGDSSPREFYRLLVKLLERHADDLLFAQEDKTEILSVLKSIVEIGNSVDGDTTVKIAADRARALHTRLTAGLGFLGAASFSRTAPSSIEEELNEALEFAEQVNTQLQASKTNANLQNVVATAAGIAVPKVAFDRLDSVFKERRDELVVAVKSLDEELKASLSDISATIIEAKSAQDADEAKQIDQVLGLVSAGAGLRGAVAGKDPFGDVQSPVEIVQITNEIVEDAKSSGCSIGDLEALLSVDPDQRKEFPNTVADFEQDFSKLQGVGSVAEFSQAQLSGRAEPLTSQLLCVFDVNPSTLPNLQVSISRFFINSAARLDGLDNILDIDLERARLRVQRDGQEEQKKELDHLQSNINSVSKADVFASLEAMYESARKEVLFLQYNLLASYERILLFPVDQDLIEFGAKRLRANGVVAPEGDFLELAQLRFLIDDRFKGAQVCFNFGSPDVRFFYFSITTENTPTFFLRPLETGPKKRRAFALDIAQDCGAFGRTFTPDRLDNSTSDLCRPNSQFNSRLLSLAVELVGGDESLLPEGRSFLTTIITQSGAQKYRKAPQEIVSFDSSPVTDPLKDVPLRTKVGATQPQFTDICSLALDRKTFLGNPRTCSSPFSSYQLQLGSQEDLRVHPYLATVKEVRIHAKVGSWLQPCQ